MDVEVKKYQEAFDIVVNRLKKNIEVLGIIVFGSIVSGDIWSKSNIDLIVISKERGIEENIYTKVDGVLFQILYISKELFIKYCSEIPKGGSFHKAFFADKIIYCRDEEIKSAHLSARFYNDWGRIIRSLEILCNLLESIHYTRKNLNNGKIETAYQWTVDSLEYYARMILNAKGHVTSKYILSLAVNIDKGVEKLFNILSGDLPLFQRISFILEEIEIYIDENIESIAAPVLNYLRESNNPQSAKEIKNSRDLSGIDTDIIRLLEKMTEIGLIKSDADGIEDRNLGIIEIKYYI